MTPQEHFDQILRLLTEPDCAWAERRLAEDAEERVTDPAVLDLIDDARLPDEGRQLTDLDTSSRRRVDAVLDLAEPVAAQIGGTELRTALRRMTAKLVDRDLSIVLAAPPPRTAAALVWAIGSVNGAFGILSHTPEELLGPLGGDARHVSDGLPLLRALGWEDEFDAWFLILHPELTVARVRSGLFADEWEDDRDLWDEGWDDDGWDLWDDDGWDLWDEDAGRDREGHERGRDEGVS